MDHTDVIKELLVPRFTLRADVSLVLGLVCSLPYRVRHVVNLVWRSVPSEYFGALDLPQDLLLCQTIEEDRWIETRRVWIVVCTNQVF